MNMKKEEITQGKGDDSYKLLFQENKRRKNINLIQLIIGIVLVVIGSLIFMLQLSVELPVLSVGLGLWLIIHYKNNNNVLENAINFPPKKYKLKESIESISFLSFNLLTIIIVLIPFILGIVNALIFGLEGEDTNMYGDWFNLNVLGYFVPLSFVPMAFSIGMLFYIFFISARITISNSEKFIQIKESRPIAPMITEIPKENIIASRITDGYMGKKYIFIFLLGFQILYIYMHGFYFLFNPFNISFYSVHIYHIILGWACIISSTVELSVVLILLFKPPTFLEIVTDLKRYEMHLSPLGQSKVIRRKIEDLIGITSNSVEENINDKRPKFDFLSRKNGVADWSNLFAGLIFLLTAWLCTVLKFFAGTFLIWILFLSGFALIVKGLKEDIIPKDEDLSIKYDKNQKTLYFNRKNKLYETKEMIKECNSEDMKYGIKMPRADGIVFGMGPALAYLIGMTISSYFKYVPYTSPWFLFGFLYILFGLIILVLYLNAMINPQNTLSIDTKSLKYSYFLPGTFINDQNEEYARMTKLNQIKNRYKVVIENQKRGLIIRIVWVLCWLIAGLIIA